MATLDLRNAAHKTQFRLKKGNAPWFWGRWSGLYRGLFVLATYDGGWTITTYPGTTTVDVADLNAADHWWRGGGTYEFTDENNLKLALVAAGYDAGVLEGGYSDTYGDIYTT